MCHCGARCKFLVLSFKQRLVSWDNLLILNPQRNIHKRWQQPFLESTDHIDRGIKSRQTNEYFIPGQFKINSLWRSA